MTISDSFDQGVDRFENGRDQLCWSGLSQK